MQLEFDVESLLHIKGFEMHNLVKVNDIEAVSKVLAKYVTKCPKAWGDPKDYMTYMNLDVFGETNSLHSCITEVAAAAKNAR